MKHTNKSVLICAQNDCFIKLKKKAAGVVRFAMLLGNSSTYQKLTSVNAPISDIDVVRIRKALNKAKKTINEFENELNKMTK